MLMIVPKKMHHADTSQTAYLKAAISRLCNKTALDEEGLYYLRPLFGTHDLASTDANDFSKRPARVKFNLTLNQIRPSYQVFYNPFRRQPKRHEKNIMEIVKVIDESGTHVQQNSDQLCPVGAVSYSGGEQAVSHAMVLDSVRIDRNGQYWFQFKNSKVHCKRVELPATDINAPETFYYVHIKLGENL